MKKAIYLFVALCLVSFGCFASCSRSEILKFYMPDGAPSLSVVSLMNEDYKVSGQKTRYEIVSSEKIAGLVANKTADLAIIPTNLATKVCGDDYKIFSVMTFGNLYIVGKSENFDDIIGNNLYVLNLNNVPGLTLRLMLKQENIDFSLTTQTSNNIKLLPTTANELIGGFLSNKVRFAMVAEPALSKIMSKVQGLNILCDIQDVFGEYPQSVLVVKKKLLDKKTANELKSKLSENFVFLNENLPKIYEILQKHLEIGLVTAFSNELLTSDLIERCNVKFKLAQNESVNLNQYIEKLISVDSQSATKLKEGAIYEIN